MTYTSPALVYEGNKNLQVEVTGSNQIISASWVENEKVVKVEVTGATLRDIGDYEVGVSLLVDGKVDLYGKFTITIKIERADIVVVDEEDDQVVEEEVTIDSD